MGMLMPCGGRLPYSIVQHIVEQSLPECVLHPHTPPPSPSPSLERFFKLIEAFSDSMKLKLFYIQIDKYLHFLILFSMLRLPGRVR